jgi:hypothetical protein
MFAAYRGTWGLIFTPFDTVEIGYRVKLSEILCDFSPSHLEMAYVYLILPYLL